MSQYHERYVRKNVDALDQAWKDLMLRAAATMAQRENVKARAILQQLDADYPPNGWVKANLVSTYRRWSQKVISLGQQAVRLAPQMALAHMSLAYINEKAGNIQAAINSYEQVIRTSGNDETDIMVNALYNSGMILYDNDNWRGAARRWEHALSINPSFSPARQALRQLFG
jgi:tetratricopeptide (TPR) repeat protein